MLERRKPASFSIPAVAAGLAKHYGRLPGVLFAIALIEASIVGAAASSPSSAYAISDVLSLNHSLHCKPGKAKDCYAVYCEPIVIAAALVLMPSMPLERLTNAVQTLAGVLLPSASVFLLLLCNDKQVLGPWVNSHVTNILTAVIVGVLVELSIVLTAAVAFPDICGDRIMEILVGGGILVIILGLGSMALRAYRVARGELPLESEEKPTRGQLDGWRMPPLHTLKPGKLTPATRMWMGILRGHLVVAASWSATRCFSSRSSQ